MLLPSVGCFRLAGFPFFFPLLPLIRPVPPCQTRKAGPRLFVNKRWVDRDDLRVLITLSRCWYDEEMGHKILTLQLPTDYGEDELRGRIARELKIRDFSYQKERQSLDARKKDRIHWKVRLCVLSEEIQGSDPPATPSLDIPYRKRNRKAVVVGSGPAGFFSALVLQRAGFDTRLIERGSEVQRRAERIQAFEETGLFSATGNYAFGEGGAGTFSDGKLTSRSKHSEEEKRFILASYIEAGAPEEIGYMAHPHLGSDRLRKIVANLREAFLRLGGTVFFETLLEDLKIKKGRVIEATTTRGGMEADHLVVAPGHSAYETYRMLIRRGVSFRTKNFAIGCRLEHPQELINRMQWGRKSLPGVQAAEYRLTSKGDGIHPVYTFCMCPGGSVVQASPYENTSLVNGMSRYRRNGRFANAACVAGVNPDQLVGAAATPLQALDWLGRLEESFYRYSNGFALPFCRVQDFIDTKEPSGIAESSYSLGLKPAALWDLLPREVSRSLREGLKSFTKRMKGFETGNMMGLESKTSSLIRVEREESSLCKGFENLYVVGEGSGYAGGILSSGADGIRAALAIIRREGG